MHNFFCKMKILMISLEIYHGISINASFLGKVFVNFCFILLTNQKLGFAHTANQLLFFQPQVKKEIGGARDKDNFFVVWLLEIYVNKKDQSNIFLLPNCLPSILLGSQASSSSSWPSCPLVPMPQEKHSPSSVTANDTAVPLDTSTHLRCSKGPRTYK